MSAKTIPNRIELLTIAICLACLPMVLAPSGRVSRELAKRMLCLANLRQLTSAWNLYADDNDDLIVNGAPLGREGYADPGAGSHKDEIPWVGRVFSAQYQMGVQLPEQTQADAIEAGALWPYVQNLDIYRCPNGYPGEMLNYAAMDSVNGLRRTGTSAPGVFLKRRRDIVGSPALRMVYIDEGWATPDSFGVHYNNECWWDDPPVRHGDGVTLSFIDGHTEHHQWQGVATIEFGRAQLRIHSGGSPDLDSEDARADLHYIQTGCWGDLGYVPSVNEP